MSDARAAAIDQAYAELAELEFVACAMDGLVDVTVGVRGDLRAIHLDPRVSGSRDADALAGQILTAARDAAALAAPRAARVAAALLPPHADPATADLVFDPLLYELDRLASMPRGGRYGADGEPLPVLDAGIDYAALRQRVSAQRDRASHLRETATSDDGLVEATADVRCRLVGLVLDPRVFRVSDSTLLAQRITTTTHRAAGLVREGMWS